MPRKAKGIHTSPANSGVKNMPSNYAETHNDDLCLMKRLLPIYKKGTEYLETYKGLWDEESLKKAIYEFFEYCAEYDVKPAKAGLRLWLGISKSQYNDWENNPVKYGSKSDLVRQANDIMELSYVGRAEQYPTANIFLLKTSHEHIEQSKLDITSNGGSLNSSPEEVNDLVSKLGLDK